MDSCGFVEQLTPDMRCSILLSDLSAKVLRSGAAPSLPVAYTSAIDRLPIADGIGSCGTAAARRETVIVSDIDRSPLWRDYASLAKPHGLAACWSVPLLDSNAELLGTCAMYYSQPRIRIMRYRAEQIGGTFRIDRCSPHGTAIRVSCPLKEETGNIRQKVP
jgi:GAF domain-containing protein